MFIKECKEKIEIESHIVDKYNMHSIAYFDIETTGFDKDNDYIILISFGYFNADSEFVIKQYFADSLADELQVLHSFGSDLSKFTRWCSYNGIAFDEPFILRRMERNGVFFKPPVEHIDLYRMIRPYHKQLGMERCNLKSVEKFIGVEREDKIDGGMSVELYYKFLVSGEVELKDIIMLHNYEDVLNLPRIFKLIFQVESREELVREDCITEKQLKFLKSLIKKNNIELSFEVDKMSKRAASKVIDAILKGNINSGELSSIINSSY
jgi:uncharacterized protein YprB with RNaseH-like and TPR domain